MYVVATKKGDEDGRQSSENGLLFKGVRASESSVKNMMESKQVESCEVQKHAVSQAKNEEINHTNNYTQPSISNALTQGGKGS